MDFIYKREINYYETDKMGVVHHSNYIRYLEEARSRWLKELKIPMEYLENLGYTIPTLEVHCEYKSHVTVGDIITIKPIITEYNGVRMTVLYEVLNIKTKKEVIKAWTKHCFTNSKLRPINMKKNNIQIYEIFERLCKNNNPRLITVDCYFEIF